MLHIVIAMFFSYSIINEIGSLIGFIMYCFVVDALLNSEKNSDFKLMC